MFTDLTTSVNIRPGYRSDHSIVKLTFVISHFKRERGTWKLNTSLLKDKEYISLIRNCIQEEYLKYTAPIYSYVFLENCCLQDLCLTIKPDTFLEVLLRIRGETIKYTALKKKLQSKPETTLISEIEKLEAGENILDPDI